MVTTYGVVSAMLYTNLMRTAPVRISWLSAISNGENRIKLI